MNHRLLIIITALIALMFAALGSSMNLIQDAWRMGCPKVEVRDAGR